MFPTYSRLSANESGLTVEMIVRDPDDRDEWGNQLLPDFDSNQPILPLTLTRERLEKTGDGRFVDCVSKARLYIRDPLGVFSELYLLFGSWSNNFPAYHVEAFAKMVRDDLGLTVEYQEKPPEPDFPV